MNKTEIIKKAIYKKVKIEFNDGDILIGWLVPSLMCKNDYTLLPLNQFEDITTFCVSHIKHICYLTNSCSLW